MKYKSTKRFGPISTGHRQWRDDSHCQYIHGYARTVEIVFACKELDHRQWVMDFGGLKNVKNMIQDWWDHRQLVASDDPQLEFLEEAHERKLLDIHIMDVTKGHGPGIEGSCKFLFDNLNPYIEKLTNSRVYIESIRIWEHENNSAMIVNDGS